MAEKLARMTKDEFEMSVKEIMEENGWNVSGNGDEPEFTRCILRGDKMYSVVGVCGGDC